MSSMEMTYGRGYGVVITETLLIPSLIGCTLRSKSLREVTPWKKTLPSHGQVVDGRSVNVGSTMLDGSAWMMLA